jgi:Tfp pilus assembly protein PilF
MLNELLKLLEKDSDNALLRFSIGSAYLQQSDLEQAKEHLAKSLQLDPQYSAAWKLYGKALQQNGDVELAQEVLTKGIEIATDKGDIQAAKEMRVFLRRLHKDKE